MRALSVGILATAVSLAGCASSEPSTIGGIQPAPPPANASMLPWGTVMDVRLTERISAEDTQIGDRFETTVEEPIIATNGQTVVPEGAVVSGRVTGLSERDAQGRTLIRLDFDELRMSGQTYPFNAEILETDTNYEGDRLRRAGTGAVAGAIVGAAAAAVISGVELDNILKGAAIGAGAGTIIALGMGGVDPALPEGTTLRIRTTQQVVFR